MNGSCYVMNMSSWLGPLPLVQALYGLVVPVFLALTLLTNIVIVSVLTRSVNSEKIFHVIVFLPRCFEAKSKWARLRLFYLFIYFLQKRFLSWKKRFTSYLFYLLLLNYHLFHVILSQCWVCPFSILITLVWGHLISCRRHQKLCTTF